ncbi:MAG TPA: outer membrane beta-barrel protein [Candidatus Saccharimonadales bacterium]|nr:outer membrane beta-barrel protein [Candidatus Saccharimonadales bacterium]
MKTRGDAYAVRAARVVALSLGGLLAGFPLQAQRILVPQTEIVDLTPSVDTASSNWVGSAGAPLLMRPAGVQNYPLELGPVHFHPHLGYSIIYGEGILRGPGDPSSTVLHTLAPGVYMNLGQHWDLDITATINRYSNASVHDNNGFYLGLRGLVPLENWIWTFGYQAGLSEEPQIETGTFTLQNTHLATASGTYSFNARYSLEVNASQDFRVTEQLTDYYTWSTLEWLNYHLTTRTTAGLGLGGGYSMAAPGVDWTFEQFQGRIVWLPGDKLSFQVSGGGQVQQFLTNGASTHVSPIVAGAVVYHVFEPTTLSFTGRRLIENAYQSGLFDEATTASVALRQRLFRQLYLTLQPGYDLRRYREVVGDHGQTRRDEYLTFYGALSTQLFKKLSLLAFYQYGDNNSTQPGFTFHETQVGFRVDYRY